MATPTKPTVGRIVHVYDPYLKEVPPQRTGPWAAIVTHVHQDGTTIDASGFPQRVISDMDHLPFSADMNADGKLPAWWCWPERV